jgi:hypothetical protein
MISRKESHREYGELFQGYAIPVCNQGTGTTRCSEAMLRAMHKVSL